MSRGFFLRKTTALITATLMLLTPLMTRIGSAETPSAKGEDLVLEGVVPDKDLASLFEILPSPRDLEVCNSSSRCAQILSIYDKRPLPARLQDLFNTNPDAVQNDTQINEFFKTVMDDDFIQQKFQEIGKLGLQGPANSQVNTVNIENQETAGKGLLELAKTLPPDEEKALIKFAADDFANDLIEFTANLLQHLTPEQSQALEKMASEISEHLSLPTAATGDTNSTLTKVADFLSSIICRPAYAKGTLFSRFSNLSTGQKVGLGIIGVVVIAGGVVIALKVSAAYAAALAGSVIVRTVISAGSGVGYLVVQSSSRVSVLDKLIQRLPEVVRISVGKGFLELARQDIINRAFSTFLRPGRATAIYDRASGIITIIKNGAAPIATTRGEALLAALKQVFGGRAPVAGAGGAVGGIVLVEAIHQIRALSPKPTPPIPTYTLPPVAINLTKEPPTPTVETPEEAARSDRFNTVKARIIANAITDPDQRSLGTKIGDFFRNLGRGNGPLVFRPPSSVSLASPLPTTINHSLPGATTPLGNLQLPSGSRSTDREAPPPLPVADQTRLIRSVGEVDATKNLGQIPGRNVGAAGVPTNQTGGGQVATPFANRTVSGTRTNGSTGTSAPTTTGSTGTSGTAGTIGDVLGNTRTGTPASSGGTNPPAAAPAPRTLTDQEKIEALKQGGPAPVFQGEVEKPGQAAPQGPQAPATVGTGFQPLVNGQPLGDALAPPAPGFTPSGEGGDSKSRQFTNAVVRFLSKGNVTDQPITKVSSGSGVGGTTLGGEKLDLSIAGPARVGPVDPENPEGSGGTVKAPAASLDQFIFSPDRASTGSVNLSEIQASQCADGFGGPACDQPITAANKTPVSCENTTCQFGLVKKLISSPAEYECVEPPLDCKIVNLSSEISTVCNEDTKRRTALAAFQGNIDIVASGDNFVRTCSEREVQFCPENYHLKSCEVVSPERFGYVCELNEGLVCQ